MNRMKPKRVDTPNGMSWHVKIFHPESTTSGGTKVPTSWPTSTYPSTSPPYLVLIPSGEGDCASQTTVATLLSSPPYSYTVVTFDTPSFSRTTAPKCDTTDITPQLLAEQIIGSLDAYHIDHVAFFGCSSGGSTILTLAALYLSRVNCGIVHEVPLELNPEFNEL